MSILVVEDEPATRAYFANALSRWEAVAAVTAVEDLRAARRAIKQESFDVLLTDLALPDGHGLDLIRSVRKSHPTLQILVITVFADEQSVVDSVLAGAHGYLLKDGSEEELRCALRDLMAGGSPLSPAVARYVLKMVQAGSTLPPLRKGARDKAPNLSRREIEVLELLAKGFNPSEIAELCQISPHTVIAHARSIHRKLEVNSRAEAVFEAISLGLLRI